MRNQRITDGTCDVAEPRSDPEDLNATGTLFDGAY